MFIIAHLDIIAIVVLMAFPFYFFNRYLLRKFKPAETGKNAIKYFAVVFITALLYSIAGVIVIRLTGHLLH